MPEIGLLPPVGSLYGAFYFGTVLSTAFYGVACMQIFFYFVHYQDDPLRMKIFVAVVWALNTLHEGVIVSGSYKYIMAGVVDPMSFLIGNPEIIFALLITFQCPHKAFSFIEYTFVVSGRIIVIPFLWVLSAVVQLGGVIIYVARTLYIANGLRVVDLSILRSRFLMILSTICLSVAAAVDILLAIFLIFLLLRRRPDGSKSTGHMLQTLVAFAVNTGIWTATFALLTIVLLHVFPNNVLYAVVGIPLCPVYCNTLLANLNARTYIKGGWTTHEITFEMDMFSHSIPRSGRTNTQYSTRDSKPVVPSRGGAFDGSGSFGG